MEDKIWFLDKFENIWFSGKYLEIWPNICFMNI